MRFRYITHIWEDHNGPHIEDALVPEEEFKTYNLSDFFPVKGNDTYRDYGLFELTRVSDGSFYPFPEPDGIFYSN